jgi:hypothetical protein
MLAIEKRRAPSSPITHRIIEDLKAIIAITALCVNRPTTHNGRSYHNITLH